MANAVGYATVDSPIGPLLVAATERGLCFIQFGAGEPELLSLARWCLKHGLGEPIADEERTRQAVTEIGEYFAGQRKQFDVQLDLYGTPFQKAVWTALTQIPYGETRSYKEIALAVGQAKAVRAVGGANNRNPIPVIVPCHRVIGANGHLVGYGGGLSVKQRLLAQEGVSSYAQQDLFAETSR